MPSLINELMLAEVTEVAKAAVAIIIIDSSKLNAEDAIAFRAKLRGVGAKLKCAKSGVIYRVLPAELADPAEAKREVNLLADQFAVGEQAELSPPGRQVNALDALDQALSLHAIADQVGDRSDADVMLGAELLELRATHHASVVGDHFATDGGGFQTRERAEIDHRLGVPGADEDAALAGTQRQHVTGAREVVGRGGVIDEHPHGGAAVEGADAGRRAFDRIDSLGHRRAVTGRVLAGHHRQAELVEPLPGGGDERHAPAELQHEVDVLGGAMLGGDDEVAFVLTAFIIHEHDGPAGAKVVQNVGNRAEHPSENHTRRRARRRIPGDRDRRCRAIETKRSPAMAIAGLWSRCPSSRAKRGISY